MNYFVRRFIIGIIFGILSGAVMLLSKYGDVAELTGAIFSGFLLAISIYFLVGGSSEELKNNRDRKGRKYSWKNSIIGLSVFIISIPFVIWLTLYLFGYL